MDWDVFISHASEDHEIVARPLAERLRGAGLRVWIDEQELAVGNSLRRHIDEGLARSRWGIVILSPSFLTKDWPQAELDALMSRELTGERVLLPVWHDISAAELATRAPLLAARLGVDTARGLERVATELLRAMRRSAAVNSSPPEQTFLSSWSALPMAEKQRSAALEDLTVGRGWMDATIGNYVLKKLVGAGGAGAVFKALHVGLGTTAALKLFYPIHGEVSQLVGATERAVKGLATLRHPNVAQFVRLRLR
jgi:hypothetical protein